MKVNRIGIDLAKNVFQLHGVDNQGKVVLKKRLSRDKWLSVFCESVEPGSEVGMEACGGAHHWARQLQARGFVVKVIAPQFVTPYVKSNKNDANDAEAICEAMSRPNMRFVKPKDGLTARYSSGPPHSSRTHETQDSQSEPDQRVGHGVRHRGAVRFGGTTLGHPLLA